MRKSFLPRKVQIETTNLCNYNCKICPRKKMDLPLKRMNYKFFKRILKKLGGVKEIDLTGWGEPLTNKDIFRIIKRAKLKNKVVSLTTNSSLLYGENLNQLLDSGLDKLAISLDSIEPILESDHSLKNNNIIRLMDSDHKIKIRLQSVLIKDNLFSFKRIINFAGKNNIKVLRLIRMDPRFISSGMKRISKKREKIFFYKLVPYARANGVKLEMIQYNWGKFPINILFSIIRDFVLKRYCPKIFSSFYITCEGKVTPCCNLPKYFVGDLRQNSLSTIWKNKKYKEFRKNFRDYCGNCDVSTA